MITLKFEQFIIFQFLNKNMCLRNFCLKSVEHDSIYFLEMTLAVSVHVFPLIGDNLIL